MMDEVQCTQINCRFPKRPAATLQSPSDSFFVKPTRVAPYIEPYFSKIELGIIYGFTQADSGGPKLSE